MISRSHRSIVAKSATAVVYGMMSQLRPRILKLNTFSSPSKNFSPLPPTPTVWSSFIPPSFSFVSRLAFLSSSLSLFLLQHHVGARSRRRRAPRLFRGRLCPLHVPPFPGHASIGRRACSTYKERPQAVDGCECPLPWGAATLPLSLSHIITAKHT